MDLRLRYATSSPLRPIGLGGNGEPSFDLKQSGVIPNNPQLITDMNAYNTPETATHHPAAPMGYN